MAGKKKLGERIKEKMAEAKADRAQKRADRESEAVIASERSGGAGASFNGNSVMPAANVSVRERSVDGNGDLNDSRKTIEAPVRTGWLPKFRMQGDAVSVEDKKQFSSTTSIDANGGRHTEAKIGLSNRGQSGRYVLDTQSTTSEVPGGTVTLTKGNGVFKKLFGGEKQVKVEGQQFTAADQAATGANPNSRAVIKSEMFALTDVATGKVIQLDQKELTRYLDGNKRVSEFNGTLQIEGENKTETVRKVKQDVDDPLKWKFTDLDKGDRMFIARAGSGNARLSLQDGDVNISQRGVYAIGGNTKTGLAANIGAFFKNTKIDLKGLRSDGSAEVGETKQGRLSLGVGASVGLEGAGAFGFIYAQGGRKGNVEAISANIKKLSKEEIKAIQRHIGVNDDGDWGKISHAALVRVRNEHLSEASVTQTKEERKEIRDGYTDGQLAATKLSQREIYYLRHSLGQQPGISLDSSTMSAIKEMDSKKIKELAKPASSEVRKEATAYMNGLDDPKYSTVGRKEVELYNGGPKSFGGHTFSPDEIRRPQLKSISGHTLLGPVAEESTAVMILQNGKLRAPFDNELTQLGCKVQRADVAVIELNNYHPAPGGVGRADISITYMTNSGEVTKKVNQHLNVHDVLEIPLLSGPGKKNNDNTPEEPSKPGNPGKPGKPGGPTPSPQKPEIPDGPTPSPNVSAQEVIEGQKAKAFGTESIPHEVAKAAVEAWQNRDPNAPAQGTFAGTPKVPTKEIV